MGLLSEFKVFAVKGNIVDMTTDIIVGAVLDKTVSSFVGDATTSSIELLIGGISFPDLAMTLGAAEGDASAVALAYDEFIQTILNLVVVVFTIFMEAKATNHLKREEAAAPFEPPVPGVKETLLTEICDLLKARQNRS